LNALYSVLAVIIVSTIVLRT